MVKFKSRYLCGISKSRQGFIWDSREFLVQIWWQARDCSSKYLVMNIMPTMRLKQVYIQKNTARQGRKFSQKPYKSGLFVSTHSKILKLIFYETLRLNNCIHVSCMIWSNYWVFSIEHLCVCVCVCARVWKITYGSKLKTNLNNKKSTLE